MPLAGKKLRKSREKRGFVKDERGIDGCWYFLSPNKKICQRVANYPMDTLNKYDRGFPITSETFAKGHPLTYKGATFLQYLRRKKWKLKFKIKIKIKKHIIVLKTIRDSSFGYGLCIHSTCRSSQYHETVCLTEVFSLSFLFLLYVFTFLFFSPFSYFFPKWIADTYCLLIINLSEGC
jgi:hypothetical protein